MLVVVVIDSTESQGDGTSEIRDKSSTYLISPPCHGWLAGISWFVNWSKKQQVDRSVQFYSVQFGRLR